MVRWFESNINTLNSQKENYRQRLINDSKAIRILTVHKSKGLEFPIVFYPFASDFRIQKYPIFHDRKKFELWIDLRSLKKNAKLAEEERMSEDLRLLYVAVTRSICHCIVGISSIFSKICKDIVITDTHLSAIGYLIQNGKPGDEKFLRKKLKALLKHSNGDIHLRFVDR